MEAFSAEEWTKTLRLIIGTRRLLLVIDDAWRIEAALAFKVGGPHCAYLMTTRFPPIALQFAPNDAIIVPELAEDDDITLLTRFAPEVLASEPVQARRLVKAVGGLPLAVTIMGKYLQKEAHSRQPRRIRAALDRLQHGGHIWVESTGRMGEGSRFSFTLPSILSVPITAAHFCYRRSLPIRESKRIDFRSITRGRSVRTENKA